MTEAPRFHVAISGMREGGQYGVAFTRMHAKYLFIEVECVAVLCVDIPVVHLTTTLAQAVDFFAARSE